jgi:putative heme-binding domain-containing protein
VTTRVILLAFLLQAGAEDLQKALRLVADPAAPLSDREGAVKGLARSKEGGRALLALVDRGAFPEELRATAAFALAANPELRAEADRKLPLPKSRDGAPLPPIARLLEMKGDGERGGRVYRDPKGPNCIACHQIGDEGRLVGPPLTTIGNKLSREQMFESILTPSAGLLMGYENWIVRTKSGDLKTGIKVEDVDDHVTLKDANGEYVDIPRAMIDQMKQLKLSMMPEDITKSMSVQDLVDVVEYMTRQK